MTRVRALRWILCCALLGAASVQAATVDETTGLVRAPGFEEVRRHCTACHSGRLVAQNRADEDGWRSLIRWMQESQGLWDLGAAEAVIVDYLATNYRSVPRGRRAPLSVVFERETGSP